MKVIFRTLPSASMSLSVADDVIVCSEADTLFSVSGSALPEGEL